MTVAAEPTPTAERYREFALTEARGRSPVYESLALGVAGDPAVLERIDELPQTQRQPNLVLAAVRYHHGTVTTYPAFRSVLLDDWDRIARTARSRRTQTNEVARCATLLPWLAALPQPLALLEIGASAGLCLLLDQYRYDFGDGPFGPAESTVTLRCAARGPTPVPRAVPQVAWRAGCDLAPLNPADDDTAQWLEALVWPGEADRAARLRAALLVARRHRVELTARDVRDGIGDLVAGAPPDATLVIFHSAVLTYLEPTERLDVARHLSTLGARWIANEGPGVVQSAVNQLESREVADHAGEFLISLDGAPVAWSDPHGTWVTAR